ncbi:transcription initiation factor tfiid subunit 12 [Anaeramoeba ignava]|uniref:Transcription initiation factor tfiid subunit 12 n=1 Tax=Anaeramoeba ignava TaxID=1746090 RepID=A0A9Q0LST2_ANAIG|nr:transcription initiation factor tfiid subunit 12 [Anaeramoeba ignava]
MSEKKLLSKRAIREILARIEPFQSIEPDAQKILEELAEEFVHQIVNSACEFAKHRESKYLNVQDISLSLEELWPLSHIPGIQNQPSQNQQPTEAHFKRQNEVEESKLEQSVHTRK